MKVSIDRDRVGNEFQNNFIFDCSSDNCLLILQGFTIGRSLNFHGLMTSFHVCRPASFEKF